MSFMGMFGGMDMDKPFYKSRMFIGGTIACIALLGVEYYVRIVSFSFPPLPSPSLELVVASVFIKSRFN